MRTLIYFAGAVVVVAPLTTAGMNELSPPEANYSTADIASGTAFQDLSDMTISRMRYTLANRSNTACTFDNAAVRVEFRKMSQDDRRSFTDAITCLQELPPQTMTEDQGKQYPGVKSRYDEYVATHINYTYNIHMTADFLAWHRFFIFRWEQDLSNHCGYKGQLPYWNWALDAEAPQESEVFNGDEYSMGSNGAMVANRSDTWLGLENVTFPPGTGGGCVTTGPFTNYTVNMGPIDSPFDNNVNDPFDYNPRCLIRDFNPWFSTRYNTYANITDLILSHIYIEDFQSLMQGFNSNSNKFGLHGGGHWIGGGPSTLADFHSSPGDPIFYLHHAMLDHVWLIWQYLDITRRQLIINGTWTLNNSPASAAMSLDDKIPFGFVAPDQTMRDLMDTFAGPYCYRYD